jgi:predicted permease
LSGDLARTFHASHAYLSVKQIQITRGGVVVIRLKQDLRYAWRTLLHSPVLSTVIVLSIALGIAANTTVFSVANGLLWGLLPVKDPGRLVMFSEGKSFSYPDYLDYRDQTTDLFEGGITAHFPIIPASVGGTGAPERVWGQAVSGNYFSMLGLKMAVGRPILPREDEVLGRDAVVVLGHNLWVRRFAGDPGIVNRAITLNGKAYTVAGVAPQGFEGTERGIVADYWVPLTMAEIIMPDLLSDGGGRNNRDHNWLMLDARLKPGVSQAQALSAINVIKQRLDDKYRASEKRHEPVTLQTAGGLVAGSATPAYLLVTVLMVMVAALLLVVCANVGNLLLARAAGRQKEIAVRIALGAGRRRLIGQLLIESILLTSLGAIFGLMLAALAANALSRFQLPVPLPIKFDFHVDLRVLLFTALLTPVTALLFGLVPALRATRPDLAEVLKSGREISTPGRRFGMRNTLVVLQVTVSVVLLVAAGLFLRSMKNAASIEIGFMPDDILITAVDPKIHGYSDQKTTEFLSQLREQVTAMPGVRSVSFVDMVPLSMASTTSDFSAEGSGGTGPRAEQAVIFHVSDGYFKTMGMQVLRGRDFQRQPELNGAILNERMATRLFPHQDPVGRMVQSGKTNYTVLGVAQNAKARFIGEKPSNTIYLQLGGAPTGSANFFGTSMLVKTAGDPRPFEKPVREAIAALDPNMAVFNTETMQQHVSKSLLLPRISSMLLGVVSMVGLGLASIGLFAVMNFWVRRRVHEIGIRMALGARAGTVLTMVLRQGLTMTGIGLAIGIGIAMLLGRFIAGLLYGVSGTDLATCAVVSGVFVGTAFVSTLVPALRAARIEPSTALRHE